MRPISLPKLLGQSLVIAALYFAVARVGFTMAFLAEQVTVVWPPTGLALFCMFTFGLRIWPGIFLGAFLANVTANEPISTAAGIGLGNTLEAVAGAWLLRYVVAFQPSMNRIRDVIGLVLVCIFATPVSASMGVSCLCLGGVQPWSHFASMWWVWWLGDAIGGLLFAPMLFTWHACWRSQWNRNVIIEGVVVLVGMILACLCVLVHGRGVSSSAGSMEYVVFPFAMWAALRLGQVGTTALVLIASSIAILATVNSYGPFVQPSLHASLLFLQGFNGVFAFTSLLLGAAMAERRQLESQLHARVQQLVVDDRAKDEFLATLAHELRNPLAPLRNAIHLLAQPMAPDDRASLVEMMRRQLGHLIRLVDDLLDAARIRMGKINLLQQRVDLARIIEDAVHLTKPLIEGKQQLLTTKLSSSPHYVNGDPVRLAQVFANLLSNASKFSNRGDEISVTQRCSNHQIEISVSDCGVGIEEDLLPHIFDLFVQGTRPVGDGGGLGIGLNLVRQLVEMHGGSVEVRSAGPGKGSAFSVRLPSLEAAGSETPAALTSAENPVRLRRILVVDDNSIAAKSFAMMLRADGHEVSTVYSGRAALEAVQVSLPEIVLLDLGMPGMSGYDVARYLRDKVDNHFVLVALTGYGGAEDRQRSLEAGFDHHLLKPVDPQELKDLIASLP